MRRIEIINLTLSAKINCDIENKKVFNGYHNDNKILNVIPDKIISRDYMGKLKNISSYTILFNIADEELYAVSTFKLNRSLTQRELKNIKSRYKKYLQINGEDLKITVDGSEYVLKLIANIGDVYSKETKMKIGDKYLLMADILGDVSEQVYEQLLSDPMWTPRLKKLIPSKLRGKFEGLPLLQTPLHFSSDFGLLGLKGIKPILEQYVVFNNLMLGSEQERVYGMCMTVDPRFSHYMVEVIKNYSKDKEVNLANFKSMLKKALKVAEKKQGKG